MTSYGLLLSTGEVFTLSSYLGYTSHATSWSPMLEIIYISYYPIIIEKKEEQAEFHHHHFVILLK